MRRKTLFAKYVIVLSMLIFFASGAFSQTIGAGGVVKDADTGEPLAGVSVFQKGVSTNGTMTDIDGNFSINVPKGATLTFSYIGYADIQLVAATNLVVSMKSTTNALNEVVAIGYGTQKKSLVTGAIAKVSGKALENKQFSRFDQALQGQAAGVIVMSSNGAPTSAPTVRIRGTSSINNSDPIYVVDGVILNGGIDYLNPNDVASIEVLKDAASAAIYGTRAANGVIIVTTKKGTFNSPIKVNYSGQTGFQNPIRKVRLANATQYAQLRNMSLLGDGNVPPFSDPAIFGTGTDWQDHMFSKNAPYNNQSVNLAGGTDNATYFLSMGYIGQKGIVSPEVAFNNSLSFTTNTSFKIGKYVSVGENLSYTYRKSNLGMNPNTEFGGPLTSALNLDPITPVYVDEQTAASGSQYQNPYILKAANGMYYGISSYVQNECTNPVAWAETQKGNYDYSHNIVGNAYIDIHPITGLNYRSQINVKKAFWGHEGFTPLYYLNANNNNTNQVSQGRNMETNLTWNWDNYISYDKTISLHTLGVMIGMSALRQDGQHMYMTYVGEPITNREDASFNFNLPQAQRLGRASDDQIYSLVSYFGRIAYNYNEKYLFMGIIRRDGSSKFGANNRWGIFPSAQAGWVVTRENFFPQNTFVDNLKIRVSYGVNGNDMSLGNFQFQSMVLGGGDKNYVFGSDGILIGYSPSAPANPDLKWEQSASFNAGFDAMLFKNFTATFDYYNRKTIDMLMQPQIPAFAGFSASPWANVGNLTNWGVELELGYNKNFGKDFRLNLNGNISYNRNEVTFLGGGKKYIDGGVIWQNSTYPLTRIAVGHPVGAFYGYKNLGTFKTQEEINSYGYTDEKGVFQLYQPNAKPGDLKWWKNPDNKDVNDKGVKVISQGDRTFIGDPTPHWTYGLTVNLGWKNLDLMVFGQGVWGNQIFQAYRRLDLAKANYPIEALNAWTVLNPQSNYPRLSETDNNKNFSNPSDFYLQNGAYFRLKTLQLGYTIPKILTNSLGIERIRIFGSITNLLTLTKYTGFDPEVGGNTGVNANGQNNGNYGVDYAVYPQVRTFIFGLNIGI